MADPRHLKVYKATVEYGQEPYPLIFDKIEDLQEAYITLFSTGNSIIVDMKTVDSENVSGVITPELVRGTKPRYELMARRKE